MQSSVSLPERCCDIIWGGKINKEEIKIICDPGSTHGGDFDTACKLINIACLAGATAIKFQLFRNLHPNIELPYRWFPELKKKADDLNIECFASVWDFEGMETLFNCGCKSVKFSYSQKNSYLITTAIQHFDTVYISGDIMSYFFNASNIKKLYCIPEYPVKYQIDFENIFPNFQGFSDHSLGYGQTLKAIDAGAEIIEKHIKPENCVDVPDAKFALKPIELIRMVEKIRSNII